MNFNFNDLMNFNKFVAPSLIRVVYWIGIVGIVISTLMMMAGGGMMMGMMGGAGEYGGGGGGGFNPLGAIIALIVGACWLLIWRVLCEVWIVMFSINDRLGILADRSGPPRTP